MKFHTVLNLAAFGALLLAAGPSVAQSFRVQCPGIGGTPQFTNLHPDPSVVLTNGVTTAVSPVTGAPIGSTYAAAYPGQIKCQEISGGDGYATMGDGHQIYLFAFGPLSGIGDLTQGRPATELNTDFIQAFPATAVGDPITSNAAIQDPVQIMNSGVLAGNAPAPLMAINEDDEFFLTLSNVGMIMRPDLFEQHTVHFHGYPNASSYFDGVPDASVAINIAGSFTYYYTAPDAGTYFWHCHITPPEHLQMGMEGQLYVRPRQNKVTEAAAVPTTALKAALAARNAIAPASLNAGLAPGCADILCTGQTPVPTVVSATSTEPKGAQYAYNDGDGSTRFDVEYPIQMMGFDPNFHFIGMTFNPESFQDMKDKYFLLNGRGYPDTINPNAIATEASDGISRPSQPLPALVKINRAAGQTRALLRISDLSVTEFTTLATIGIPMQVVGNNARLLRDFAGNNLYYYTNSITMGGGESIDVILDVSDTTKYPVTAGAQQIFYLYSTELDHLSNDAENFGGMMTEIVVQD